MEKENTLITDLNRRIEKAGRYKATSMGQYFEDSRLDWWKPEEKEPYIQQKEQINKWLDNNSFRNTLEIGPGFGRITQLLSNHTDDLTLVEVNKKANRMLKKTFPNSLLIEDSIEDAVDKLTDRYELICAVEILVHIPNIPWLLKEIHNRLDDDGIFITSITKDTAYQNRYTVIHRGINPLEFENEIDEVGFTIVDKVEHDHLLTYLLTKS
jgi:2-polyprenyl-3-methyl-5-hydroxy-6-metoxy-1,4-benzoquinol methylase